MIELFIIRNEKIERLAHASVETTSKWIDGAGKSNVWIRCVKPDSGEIEQLSVISNISIDDLKESVEENERSKVSVGKHIEIVFKVPAIESGDMVPVPFYIYASGSQVVTIERTPTKVLNELSSALFENKRRFLFRKPCGYFIYYILDRVNDEFLAFIDKVSIKIDLFRERKALSKKSIETIYDTGITLSYFNQALIANIDVLNELRKSYFRMFHAEDRNNFAELYHDSLQILDTERIQREVLSNLFNMHATITGNELNRFMKVIAFIALLTTVPSIITSIYSMNIRNVPFVQSEYAFYVLVGIIVASSIGSYLMYRFLSNRWQ